MEETKLSSLADYRTMYIENEKINRWNYENVN